MPVLATRAEIAKLTKAHLGVGSETVDHMIAQSDDAEWGLWSRDTPMGGTDDPPTGGYFMDYSYDTLSFTSFHVLTTDGIRGRDKLGDG